MGCFIQCFPEAILVPSRCHVDVRLGCKLISIYPQLLLVQGSRSLSCVPNFYWARLVWGFTSIVLITSQLLFCNKKQLRFYSLQITMCVSSLPSIKSSYVWLCSIPVKSYWPLDRLLFFSFLSSRLFLLLQSFPIFLSHYLCPLHLNQN